MQNVLTPTGYKPMNEIQVGDDVLAFDVFTGEQIINQVLDKVLWNFSPESPFFDGKFYTINGTWKCYGEQSIWRNDNQVVHIKNLVVGDTIFNGSDEDVVVTSIEETTDTEWYKFEISNDHSYVVDNLTLHNASRFWVGGTGTWSSSNTTNWSGTTGGAGGSSVPGSADTATFDALSGTGTVTPNYDMTVTSITCGAMGALVGTPMILDFSANNNSPTMSTFSGAGVGFRTINMGSGTWTLTGNAAEIFNIGTTTNLTFNINTATLIANYSGSTGTRSFRSGDTSAYALPTINVTAGADSINTYGGSSSARYYGINFTGFSGIWALTGSFNDQSILGNLTLSATMTVSSSSGKFLVFKGTSAQTITTNGVNLGSNIEINASTANVSLLDNLVSTSGSFTTSIQLTSGIFNANNFNLTCGAFNSSNSNTRTLTMGSGTWTLTGNAATLVNLTTTTNLTLISTGSTLDFNNAGAVGARNINIGSPASFPLNNLKISAGGGTVAFTSGTVFNGNVDTTGSTASCFDAALTIKGDFTIGASSTIQSNTGAITFGATSGTKTITTNGVTINKPVTLDGVGGTWQLADSFSMLSSRTMTLTNGTFSANNQNLSMGLFSSSNSNTRTLNLSSGTMTLSGTGTVFNAATSTNLTVTPGTSTINITDTTATSKTFAGGSKTYYNLTATGDNIIVSGSNTFNTLRLANAGLTTGLSLTSGTTQTVSSMTNNGSAGSLTKLISTSAGTPATISKTSGNVSLDYMSIKDSTATGGAVFYAGANSTNVSGNTGWFFIAAPSGGTTIGNNLANFITNAIMI